MCELSLFFDYTVAISHEQFLEVVDLFLQFVTTVGIAHQHTVVFELFKLHAAMYVCSLLDSLFLSLERFMFDELNAMAIIDERIASDASSLVIWL